MKHSATSLLSDVLVAVAVVVAYMLKLLIIEKSREKGRARGRSAEKKGKTPYFFFSPTDPILYFELSILVLVCYTAVFRGEERCVTTLKTAV